LRSGQINSKDLTILHQAKIRSKVKHRKNSPVLDDGNEIGHGHPSRSIKK
jgi:hypothetical protein